ncbi:hypothetical protein AB7M16_002422 [Bradyrhizobium sp. USDA 372]
MRVTSTDATDFESVCSNCATLAVTFECNDGALDNTPVFCRNCGRLRGLIGAVRKMAHQPATSHSAGSRSPPYDPRLLL